MKLLSFKWPILWILLSVGIVSLWIETSGNGRERGFDLLSEHTQLGTYSGHGRVVFVWQTLNYYGNLPDRWHWRYFRAEMADIYPFQEWLLPIGISRGDRLMGRGFMKSCAGFSVATYQGWIDLDVLVEDWEPPPSSFCVALPYWLLSVVCFAFAARSGRASWLAVCRRGARLCPRCGYDLRATPERCPECGKVVMKIGGAAT